PLPFTRRTVFSFPIYLVASTRFNFTSTLQTHKVVLKERLEKLIMPQLRSSVMMLLGGDAISIDSANRGYDYDKIDSEPLWDRVQELELEHYQSLFGNSISICNRTLLDPQFSCGTIQTP